MTKQVFHPMVKFQRKVASLVDANILKPTDNISKVALLYGDQWSYWKQELAEFGFSMHDPVREILMVEAWDED